MHFRQTDVTATRHIYWKYVTKQLYTVHVTLGLLSNPYKTQSPPPGQIYLGYTSPTTQSTRERARTAGGVSGRTPPAPPVGGSRNYGFRQTDVTATRHIYWKYVTKQQYRHRENTQQKPNTVAHPGNHNTVTTSVAQVNSVSVNERST